MDELPADPPIDDESPVRTEPPAVVGVSGSVDAVEHEPRPVLAARRRRRTARIWFLVVLLALFLLALALRLWRIVPAYELFIDEVTYTDLAGNLARGQGLTLDGEHPFLLHPPLSFLGMAAAMHVVGADTTLDDAIWLLRPYIAVWGALCVALTFVVMHRVVGPVIAALAALLLAMDPFGIRFDSRVLMEAEAQAVVLGTMTALVLALGARGRRSRFAAVTTAGVLAGVAMCTKETFGLVALAVLVMFAVTGWALRRREVGYVLALALGLYAVNSAVLVLLYGLGPWWSARTGGLSRLVGTTQITGFNAPTTEVSLGSRALANLDQFATSYVVLLGGTAAAVALAVSAWVRWRRTGSAARTLAEKGRVVVAAWGLASGGLLAYATLLGSIEEQMYYIALAPCAIAAVVAGSDFVRSWPRRRVPAAALALTLTAIVVTDAAVWWRTHTTVDNTYAQFMAWAPENIERGSVVSATDVSSQFLLRQDVLLGKWTTPEELTRNRVDYVLVVAELVEQGYSIADPSFVSYLDVHAPVVFGVDGRSTGALRLYDVRPLTGGSP
jgi:predicted membrane-bound dolichyl-phosphate-mannose-protein mannosyltransferase